MTEDAGDNSTGRRTTTAATDDLPFPVASAAVIDGQTEVNDVVFRGSTDVWWDFSHFGVGFPPRIMRRSIRGECLVDTRRHIDIGGNGPDDGSQCRGIEVDLRVTMQPTPPQLELCGNGVLDAGEDCDDGNICGGDGCSPICTRVE